MENLQRKNEISLDLVVLSEILERWNMGISTTGNEFVDNQLMNAHYGVSTAVTTLKNAINHLELQERVKQANQQQSTSWLNR